MPLEAWLTDSEEAEVLTSLVETDGIGAALKVRVARLNTVVLPEADFAYLVSASRCFAEREEAAAMAAETTAERRIATGELVYGIADP